jgi:hypothetical protein
MPYHIGSRAKIAEIVKGKNAQLEADKKRWAAGGGGSRIRSSKGCRGGGSAHDPTNQGLQGGQLMPQPNYRKQGGRLTSRPI